MVTILNLTHHGNFILTNKLLEFFIRNISWNAFIKHQFIDLFISNIINENYCIIGARAAHNTYNKSIILQNMKFSNIKTSKNVYIKRMKDLTINIQIINS